MNTPPRTELHLFRRWNTDPGLLPAIRGLFVYGPGENRATGYLYSAADKLDWPASWSERGPKLLDELESSTGTRFTIMAFQAYRDGSGCDWHADTPFNVHAVLSLGVARHFGVRRKGRDPEWFVELGHGDMAFMPSGFQDEWEHCVPTEDVAGERISLVFRTVRHG